MMPSANTVARDSPPPTNMSYMPSSPPPWLLLKYWVRALTSTPGTVMCEPTR